MESLKVPRYRARKLFFIDKSLKREREANAEKWELSVNVTQLLLESRLWVSLGPNEWAFLSHLFQCEMKKVTKSRFPHGLKGGSERNFEHFSVINREKHISRRKRSSISASNLQTLKTHFSAPLDDKRYGVAGYDSFLVLVFCFTFGVEGERYKVKKAAAKRPRSKICRS